MVVRLRHSDGTERDLHPDDELADSVVEDLLHGRARFVSGDPPSPPTETVADA